MVARACWGSLAAQPAQEAMAVRRTGGWGMEGRDSWEGGVQGGCEAALGRWRRRGEVAG